MSVGIKDAATQTDHGVLSKHVPEWADTFAAGATFGLSSALQSARFNVDGNIVEIGESGRSVAVALASPVEDVFSTSLTLAEKVLDLVAVEAFWTSSLHDALREHATWVRSEHGVTLRCVSTARLAVEMKSSAVVTTPEGQVKPQPTRPPQRWHASHAYFRRSQTTSNLDDSYRYLYLALESLLSEVYPWTGEISENAWLKAALRHVAEGYEIDLNEFLDRPSRNPYRRFIKEQYQAQRCALFHAKVTQSPRLPGDDGTRAELAEATRRLGRLYAKLAALITGAGFAGSAMTYAGFQQRIQPLARGSIYVSGTPEFDLDQVARTPIVFSPNAKGQPGVHQLIGTFRKPTIPFDVVRRSGTVIEKDGKVIEGFWSEEHVDLRGVEYLECVVQVELANAQNLREWFL